MSKDLKAPQLRLVSALQQSPVDSLRSTTLAPPGKIWLAGLPAMPTSLLQLELSLSASVVDLQDVTTIIKGDVGLTVQLLRLAAREMTESKGMPLCVSNTIVQFGTSKLSALVANTKPLLEHLRTPAGFSVCERFWTRARLTALIAEELSAQSCTVSSEEAYLAGLLCRLGELPSMLGWSFTGSHDTETHNIAYRMATAWKLPDILSEVIGGYGNISHTRKSSPLLDIVEAADNWAVRLELLASRDATRLTERRLTCHQ